MGKTMKQFYTYLYIMLGAFCLSSCIDAEKYDNSPRGNFEALWRIIDEQYCFLDYKAEEYGLDWNEVYNRYSQDIVPSMTDKDLFNVFDRMLAELRDGHVNLYTGFDVARYWDWYEDFPKNFSDSIQRIYLGKDYHIAAGLKYKVLDDNIGYVYYESFNDGVGDGNLSDMLQELAICKGLIIDVRNNGGGQLTNANRIASHFTNEKVLTGYICHKTGPGHSDFSEPYPVYLEPSNSIRWQKPVCVLTNRSAYSATNDFVNIMKQLQQVTIVGDKTGGGSGLPFSSELPNGWSIRFSASPMFDPQMNQLEFGIEPDEKIDMRSEDMQRGKDTIIERARQILNEKTLQ